MSARDLPDIAAILSPLLAAVAPAERPLLLAIAERMAAARYRRWAREVQAPETRVGLLACADREDEIARAARTVSLACVPLEEASALFLEGLPGA